MSDFDPSSPAPGNNRRLLALLAVGALVLCTITAVAGYSLGRASATPPPTVAETQPDEETAVSQAPAVSDTNDTPADTDPAQEATSEPVEEPPADDQEEPEPPAPVPTDEPVQEAPTPTAVPLDLDNLDIAILEEVWGIVENEFYGDLPSNDELIYGAIEGSLETLNDEYTRFTPPDVAQLLREDMGGSVEGIGAFVRDNDDGFVEIVAPIEGQPAELVGLLPGDLILEVDGEDVVGQDFYAVIAKVRGPRGSEVELTILRPSTEETLVFNITRTRFEVPTVEAEMLENDIAYLSLTEFSAQSDAQLTEAFETLMAQNPQALIFDLRNNGGGLLDQAAKIADLFMTENIILIQRDNLGNETIIGASDGDMGESIPMVVLINPASASASEIVAGALQDTGRAILVGETTFGKGSVQLLHTLSDGSELRVTIARFYTPNDNIINGVGVTPDIEVEPDFESEEDVQLQRAIDFILNGE